MRTTTPLPGWNDGQPFSVTTARNVGMSAGRLRGSDLETPFRGVRRLRRSLPVERGAGRDGNPINESETEWWRGRNGPPRRPPDADVQEIIADCRALALRLREGEVFCGVTAATLWGVQLPDSARHRELHVGVRRPGRGSRASGTIGHTLSADAEVWRRRHGVPVTDAVSTWFALASVLPLNELIAAGDHLLHSPVIQDLAERRPFICIEDLAGRACGHRGPGSAKARAALPFLVTGAESRPESLLRMLLHDAGLPPPEVNVPVFDEEGQIGRFDLVYPEWKVIVEYDGDQHRTDDRQYDRDMVRLERATLATWAVMRVRKFQLFGEPRGTARRIEAALRRGGWPGVPELRVRSGARGSGAPSPAGGR